MNAVAVDTRVCHSERVKTTEFGAGVGRAGLATPFPADVGWTTGEVSATMPCWLAGGPGRDASLARALISETGVGRGVGSRMSVRNARVGVTICFAVEGEAVRPGPRLAGPTSNARSAAGMIPLEAREPAGVFEAVAVGIVVPSETEITGSTAIEGDFLCRARAPCRSTRESRLGDGTVRRHVQSGTRRGCRGCSRHVGCWLNWGRVVGACGSIRPRGRSRLRQRGIGR
jgi:hypothetical protein